MKSIAISQSLGKSAFILIEGLIESAKHIKDKSPNASAVRIYAYLLAKRNNPLNTYLNKDYILKSLFKHHSTYVRGSNNLEKSLILTNEEELEFIAYLNLARQNSINRFSNESKITENIRKRKLFLEENKFDHLEFVVDKIHYVPNSSGLSIAEYHFSNELDQQEKEALLFFTKNQSAIGFLTEFDEFARCYHGFKNQLKNPHEYKAVYYDLCVSYNNATADLNFARLAVLSIVSLAAMMKKPVPELPSLHASSQEKLKWYQTMKDLYEDFSGYYRVSLENLKIGLSTVVLFDFPSPTTIVKETVKISSSPDPLKDKQFDSIKPVLLAREGQDQLFKKWQNGFLEYQKEVVYPDHLFKTADSNRLGLNESEKWKYQYAIKEHMQGYAQDCQIAAEQQKEKRVFKKDLDFDTCIKTMEKEHAASLEHEKDLRDLIKALAHKTPTDFNQFARHMAHQIGQAKPSHKMETILRAACQKEGIEALMRLNPVLTEQESANLRSACIDMMVEATHRQHLERILTPLKKWVNEGKTDELLLEEAQEAFSDARGYDPTTSFNPLLFEYLSGLRVKAKQAHIVNFVLAAVLEAEKIDPEKKEELIGKVFQLIMAGGKTSVIISMLIELIAESDQGLFCCVLSHHSQMASVTGNLAEFQSKRFAKDIYVLDYSIQDLSDVKVLDLILKRLKEADRKHCAIVMKTTLPQIIELKFIIELLNLSQMTYHTEKLKRKEVIDNLRQINRLFRQKGVGVFDECDINLSILLNVIIPLGQPKQVKPERVALQSKIFECLVSDKHILELLGLTENKQADLSSQSFKEKVLPFIAKNIFSYKPLKLSFKEHLKEAFERFVCDQIQLEDQELADDKKIVGPELEKLPTQQQENIEFLRYLNKLANSNNRYQQEAAQLISLTKKICLKILGFSLSHSYNRSYGKDPLKNDGRVIPYLASGEHATTQFGNIYLGLAYQQQTAINDQVNEGEISFLAKKMSEAAHYYAKKEKIPFIETDEARQFKYLTGIHLTEVTEPEKMKEALDFINDRDHLTRRLAFESEISPFHVQYYVENLTHKSINNISKFKKNIACSGTLWNHATYHRGFGQAALDKGTEGSILNLVASRAEKNACIYEVKDTNLADFFGIIKTHPNKSRLRALVDGGGFLKDYSNKKVAQEFMSFFAEEENNKGPLIDAVIYLHKFSKEEIEQGQPKEAFVLLKKGQTHLEILKNTSSAEIEKHGVKIDRIFALFFEMQATGTDIPLAYDALFLNTIDHKMPIRSFLQAILRARKIFKGQTCDYIVSQKGRTEMVAEGKTFEDLKNTLIKNEAILLKEQKDRARFAQIDDVVRSAIVDELIQTEDLNQLENLIKSYRQFLVSTLDDDPYKECGRIHGKQYTIKVLEYYARDLLTRFDKTIPSGSCIVFSEIKQKINNLLEEFKKEIPPEETIDSNLGDGLNATVEIEQKQDLTIQEEKKQDVNVNTEIQNELNRYAVPNTAPPYAEKIEKLDPSKPLWKQIQTLYHPQTASSILNKTYGDRPNQVSTAKYAPCFTDAPLWLTTNFYMTSSMELPIFHPLSKLPGFVLAVENDQHHYQFVLISEAEAAYYKEFLNQNNYLKAYLLDLKGMPEVNNSLFEQHVEKNQELLGQFQKGLCYANLFSGRLEFLEKHPTLSKKLVVEQEPLIVKFLQLRIGNDPKRLFQLYSSDLFHLEANPQSLENIGVIFSWRRNKIEEKYHNIRLYGRNQVATIDPNDVEDLASHQVAWLTTKEQVARLPDNWINYLEPKQITVLDPEKVPFLTKVELIQAIKEKKQADKLLNEQLIHLSSEQLSLIEDEKLIFVSDHAIRGLKEEEQIKRIQGKRVRLFDKASQVNAILPEEVVNLDDQQILQLTHPELVKKIEAKKASFIAISSRKHIERIEVLLALPDTQGLDSKQTDLIRLISMVSF